MEMDETTYLTVGIQPQDTTQPTISQESKEETLHAFSTSDEQQPSPLSFPRFHSPSRSVIVPSRGSYSPYHRKYKDPLYGYPDPYLETDKTTLLKGPKGSAFTPIGFTPCPPEFWTRKRLGCAGCCFFFVVLLGVMIAVFFPRTPIVTVQGVGLNSLAIRCAWVLQNGTQIDTQCFGGPAAPPGGEEASTTLFIDFDLEVPTLVYNKNYITAMFSDSSIKTYYAGNMDYIGLTYVEGSTISANSESLLDVKQVVDDLSGRTALVLAQELFTSGGFITFVAEDTVRGKSIILGLTIEFEVKVYCTASVDVLALLPSDEAPSGSPVSQDCEYKYW